jgi:hypothetical protein
MAYGDDDECDCTANYSPRCLLCEAHYTCKPLAAVVVALPSSPCVLHCGKAQDALLELVMTLQYLTVDGVGEPGREH